MATTPGERRGHDGVGPPLLAELDRGLSLADQRLGGLHRPRVRLELGFRRAHLVAVLVERGLGHLNERLGGLELGARLLDVPRRDQLLGEELLASLVLAPLPLRVGARPLDVRGERPAVLPHALQVGAARVRRRARSREILANPREIGGELVDREIRLAAVQVGERLPLADGVTEVDVEADHGTRELRAGDGLLPREEAPDRVDAALNGAALDLGRRDAHGRGLDALGRRWGRRGRPGLPPREAREQEREQEEAGEARAGGGAAMSLGHRSHGRGPLYQAVVQ